MLTLTLRQASVAAIVFSFAVSDGVADENVTVDLKSAIPHESIAVIEMTGKGESSSEPQEAKHHVRVHRTENDSKQTIERLMAAAKYLPAADTSRIDAISTNPALANRDCKERYSGSESVVHSVNTRNDICEFRVSVRLYFKCADGTWTASTSKKGELWRLTKDNVLQRFQSPAGWIVANY